MNYNLKIFLILTILTTNLAYANDPNDHELLKEARHNAGVFQEELQKELRHAIKTGGYKMAIEICHKRAPKIGEDLGKKFGWKMSRTSLTTRNKNNQPNTREKAVLELFDKMKESGKNINKLDWWEEDQGKFFYMKAIQVKGICATCHGKNISKSIKDKIDKLYPNDLATGYEIGDLRGAFTLSKDLEK